MISVSTESVKSFIPCSAILVLLMPSYSKGFVTTPTVNIPLSLAAYVVAKPNLVAWRQLCFSTHSPQIANQYHVEKKI